MEHSRDMTTPQSCAFWRVSYQPCGAGLARARGFSPLQLRKACAFLLLGMALHAGADESQCRIECIPWRGCVQMDNHEVEVILADGHSRSFVELTSEQLHWTLPGYEHKIPVQRIGATDTCETMGWVPRPEPRRVWDAFTFFNELQVLRLRLHTLAPVVHRFVVAEATKTHANGPKRLYFNESKEDADIQAFLPQVEHLIVDDLPDSSDRWQLEIFQRNALVRGLAEADAQDLIIVGDCDEIPNPHAVHLLRTCDGWDVQGPVHFHTRFYNFRFDLHFEALWYHPQLSTIQWLAGPWELWRGGRSRRARPCLRERGRERGGERVWQIGTVRGPIPHTGSRACVCRSL